LYAAGRARDPLREILEEEDDDREKEDVVAYLLEGVLLDVQIFDQSKVTRGTYASDLQMSKPPQVWKAGDEITRRVGDFNGLFGTFV
jgi:hypothetical protein